MDHHFTQACFRVLKSLKTTKYVVRMYKDPVRLTIENKHDNHLVIHSIVGVIYGYETSYCDEEVKRRCISIPNNVKKDHDVGNPAKPTKTLYISTKSNAIRNRRK